MPTVTRTHVCSLMRMMGRPAQDRCLRGHEYRVSAKGRKWCPECQNAAARSRRTPRVISSLEDRIWAKVDRRGPDECWPWTASINTEATYGGYPQIREGGRGSRVLRAHRVIYALTYGSIPDGMVVDHTCHNGSGCEGRGPDCPHRRCCNPAHLEAVTVAVNNERGYHRGDVRA